MTRTQRPRAVCDRLEQFYPEAVCALHYDKPYELMIAARLSAQCTDARVNIVTETLFKKYPTLEAFANAKLEELERDIRPCGFFHTKAQSIIGMCRRLIEVYGGELPGTMEELLTLPGIGRKTANLLMGDIFGKPAVVVDTHCIRITRRLGLHKEKDPKKIEFILRDLLPPEESNDFCHRLVLHGRKTCDARKPKCEQCCMKDFCKKNI